MYDYRELAGVRGLAAKTNGGFGVKIAILDTGTPENAQDDGKNEHYADRNGHATEISSILFGGDGIIGICGGAVPKFFKVLDDKGFGSVKDVARGIREAVKEGSNIINLSLGFYRSDECPEDLKNACDEAYGAGITIVCSAGNDGSRVNWPAALKTTICVGSANQKGLKYGFSSVGEVDFVAPGENLPVIGIDGKIKYVSGTSFSTAIVSGAAALLFARFRNSAVGAGPDAIKSALRGIAVDVGPAGWDEDTGFGMILGMLSKKSSTKTRRSIFAIIFDTIKGIFSRNKRS